MAVSKKLVSVFLILFTMAALLTLPIYGLGQLKTSQGKIFNNLYADYDFDEEHSSFQYIHELGDIYNVTWQINNSLPAYWQEDIQTRLISNISGYGISFNLGTHTPVWIFTNLTIGDTVPISVDGVGDYDYNVTGELNFNYPGVGNVDIWVLEQFTWPSSIAWYEQSTGLLLNGSFISFIDSYNLTLTDTNMFSHYQESGGIPGYSLTIFIPLSLIITIVILRKQKRRLL
ncbi:MAG: Loki-CTERM sorting domain-containing protein [Promethearchaeota archaeon]|jgi:hypothetical protein